MSLFGQNLPPELLEMVVQFFLLGHSYGSKAQQLCDLFRVKYQHFLAKTVFVYMCICVFVFVYLAIQDSPQIDWNIWLPVRFLKFFYLGIRNALFLLK